MQTQTNTATLRCCNLEVLQEYGNQRCSYAHRKARVYLLRISACYVRIVNASILFLGGPEIRFWLGD
jgi:hypothetical protein